MYFSLVISLFILDLLIKVDIFESTSIERNVLKYDMHDCDLYF